MARFPALAVTAVVLVMGTNARADLVQDKKTCVGGNRGVCRRVIETMKKERDGAPRYEELQRILERACALGDGRACAERAEFLGDMALVASYRRRGCEAAVADMQSCELYGKHLLQGSGVKKNARNGTALLERACKGKAAGACRTLALANPQGRRYIPLLKLACDAGDTWVSCVALGDAYSKGERVKQDGAKAKAYYEKACKNGLASACAKAGVSAPPAKR